MIEGGSAARPPIHLQAAAGGYLRLVSPDGPVLWGLVDSDHYGVEIVRAKSAALQVVPPIRADESAPMSGWTRRFADLLLASSVTPLAQGRRYLFAPIEAMATPGLVLGPGALDELLAQEDELRFEWDFGYVGLLPTRRLSDASDGRVKMWRKRARDRTLPPIVTWWCRGLFAHVLLDGHNRLHAALLEGVKPDVIVLADVTGVSKQELEERRQAALEQAASLERIPSVAARANAMNAVLRAAWDPGAEWELSTPGFPLDVERWKEEVRGTSLATRVSMRVVHVIFILSIRSSYLRNEEHEATEAVFDTVQFIWTEQGAWRIRTYAEDEDVHTWSMRLGADELVPLARTNTEKHYGDVLAEAYIIDTSEGVDGLCRELQARGLADHLEIGGAGLMFWTPPGSKYQTRSTPS
jgi:hypothetical protein